MHNIKANQKPIFRIKQNQKTIKYISQQYGRRCVRYEYDVDDVKVIYIEEFKHNSRKLSVTRRIVKGTLVESIEYNMDNEIYRHFFTNDINDLNYLIDRRNVKTDGVKQLIYDDNQLVGYEDSFGNVWNDTMNLECPFKYPNIDVLLLTNLNR